MEEKKKQKKKRRKYTREKKIQENPSVSNFLPDDDDDDDDNDDDNDNDMFRIYLAFAQSLERQTPEKSFRWFWRLNSFGVIAALLFDAGHGAIAVLLMCATP